MVLLFHYLKLSAGLLRLIQAVVCVAWHFLQLHAAWHKLSTTLGCVKPLYLRVRRLSHKFPVITYSDPEKKKKKYIFIFIIFNFKGLFFGTMKPPIISDPGVWCVHACLCHKASVTWLSILISVSVSLSRNASTKACTPAPVMKLDSKFKLCNVLFARSMSLNAWEEERGNKRQKNCCKVWVKLLKSPQATPSHHSDWVITPRSCQAELFDVRVLLHGFGEVLQRRNWNVLKKGTKTRWHWSMGRTIFNNWPMGRTILNHWSILTTEKHLQNDQVHGIY